MCSTKLSTALSSSKFYHFSVRNALENRHFFKCSKHLFQPRFHLSVSPDCKMCVRVTNTGEVCCVCSVIWHICRIYLSMIKKTLSYDIIFEANHYICMRYQLNVKSMQDLNRLKVVLVEQKKTGKWLAEQLGKDPSTISKWCSNKIQPSLEMLSQIAKTLNVDTKELIN